METIYWEVNGEVRVKNEALLQRFNDVKDMEEPLFVEERGDEFGHFSDAIYAVPHPQHRHAIMLFVERKWVPAFGYSWSEFQVKCLEVY
jgi:hypothetical protein